MASKKPTPTPTPDPAVEAAKKPAGSRPYTGFDKIGHRRPGTEQFVHNLQKYSGNALSNLGTFGIRDMRGKPGRFSVHATGRALDSGRTPFHGSKGATRAYMLQVIDWIIGNAAELGVEMLADYEFQGPLTCPQCKGTGQRPWLPGSKETVPCVTQVTGMGRIWKCDRVAWKTQEPGAISGGGWGTWIHVELDQAHADNPALIDAVFARGTFPTIKAPAPATPEPAKA